MTRILLFPCNGNAIEAIECVDESDCIEGFIDDSRDKQNNVTLGYIVYSREILNNPEARVVAVPGNQDNFLDRARVIKSLNIPNNRFISLKHRNAFVSKRATVGINTLIMAGVVITSNARIGNHVCIMPNTVIHHDVTIGDYTIIGSNVTIAGFVSVGSNCYIGSAASIKNHITIGDKTLIGMASNVVKSVPSNSITYGNPAKGRTR